MMNPLSSSEQFEIIPFSSYYPSMDMMSSNQLECYLKIKNKLNYEVYVDVCGYISYLFVYIYGLFLTINNEVSHIDKVIGKLQKIYFLYKDEKKISGYIDFWIFDLFCLKGDYLGALKHHKMSGNYVLHPDINAGKILNIKYEFKVDVEAEEILCQSKILTKFGVDKIDDVIRYANIVLSKEKNERGMDFLQYIGIKNCKARQYNLGLFSGSPFQPKFDRKIRKFDTYCFYSIPEFMEFGKELSRSAENCLREELKLPKVGEGWISETELYYLVKSYFKRTKVVQHYSDKWLGRQHLDIYIPEYKVAIEYQGKQHYEPIEYFGGMEQLKKIQKLDACKIEKCKTNETHIIFWRYDEDISDKVLKEKLKDLNI